MTRESIIEKYLVKQAKARGGEVRKVQWIGHRGAPDRVVMLPSVGKWQRDGEWLRRDPRTLWVELKATGVDPRDGQLREHRAMRAVGQEVFVIDSLEGVDKLLGLHV